jgi:hypothetical protein
MSAQPHAATIAAIRRREPFVYQLADTYPCRCQVIHGGRTKGPFDWRLCSYHKGFDAGVEATA